MKKPELEKVIEKLEKVDIQGWDMSDYHELGRFFILTTKINGLVFNVSSCCKKGLSDALCWLNDIWYVISIQDECQKVFVEYKEDSKKGKINKFYEKLCKDLQELKKDELNRRVQELVYGLEPGKKDIEKIIEQLESIDFEEWKTDLRVGEKKYEPKHPDFVTTLYGLNICVQKGFLGSYTLKFSISRENSEITYGQNSNHEVRHMEKELIKRLYEKLYKELENKEKGFEEKLDNFLLE